MPDLTSRRILDAIHEGLMESALLTAIGYDPTQGRPGRALLNNALERLGYGRPIGEYDWDRLTAHQPYPDEWVRAIASAVTGRRDASINEVIATLRHGPSRRVSP
jgi:hypothetical protein